MGAQQKYLFHYAYLEKSSYNAIENNNLYNDERGEAEILQNYNHNSLFLNFKAGEYTAKALSVLLASDEVGLVLGVVNNVNFIGQTFDVYDLVKIGNIGLSPTVHFYEISGEFLSKQINNVFFLTRHVVYVGQGDAGEVGIEQNYIIINDGDNSYEINANVLTNGIVSFYYPTENPGSPIELVDLRDLNDFSITFHGNSIPDGFLSGYINTNCTLTIVNATSIMKIGNNVFKDSEFFDIVANFSGIRELGKNINLAKKGGIPSPTNPLGLQPYDCLSIHLTSDVQEIDGLIIASDCFGSGIKTIINDCCGTLNFLKGELSEIKNCKIYEDFANLNNLSKIEVTFENCEFVNNQKFSANIETRKLLIKNCNIENYDNQVFTFTGFQGQIIIENSFKSYNASYDVDDTAAYKLIIDNNSFINAGTNSGSLNKVLSSENRNLPPLVGSGAFLRINRYNILSFTGNNYLTIDGQLLTINEITSLEFSIYKKWDLKNGNFSFVNFNVGGNLYLYDDQTKQSYINKFVEYSFFNLKSNVILNTCILGTQLIEILSVNNCLVSSDVLFSSELYIYNNLPADFNYLTIKRNNTSFIFNNIAITIFNDNNNQLKEALQLQYPEYTYL